MRWLLCRVVFRHGDSHHTSGRALISVRPSAWKADALSKPVWLDSHHRQSAPPPRCERGAFHLTLLRERVLQVSVLAVEGYGARDSKGRCGDSTRTRLYLPSRGMARREPGKRACVGRHVSSPFRSHRHAKRSAAGAVFSGHGGPWAFVCIQAVGDARSGWAIGAGAMAMVSYLIAPAAVPPRFGLDHEFSIDSPEFVGTVAGASGSPFLDGKRRTVRSHFPRRADAKQRRRPRINAELSLASPPAHAGDER